MTTNSETIFNSKLSADDFKNAPSELGIVETDTNLNVWNILDMYFRDRGLVYHKLSSYDALISDISNIIRNTSEIVVEDRKSQNKYSYTFGNVSVIPPSIMPQESRLRNIDYSLSIVVDIIQTFVSTLGVSTQKVFRNLKICEIPLMIKSRWCNLYGKTRQELIDLGECPEDTGGYYLINGKERVIVIQERPEYNRIQIRRPDKQTEKIYEMMAENRSVIIRGSKPSVVKVFIESSRNVICQIPSLKEAIQVGTILHACGHVCGLWEIGHDSSNDIKRMIVGDDNLQEDYHFNEIVNNILENSKYFRNENCISHIGALTNASILKDQHKDFVANLFRNDIFVNIPVEVKPFYLAYMVRKMIMVYLGRQHEDDRDHFANKRCDTDGKLIEDLFRGFFARYLENVTNDLSSHPTNVNLFERDFTISQEIHRCMSTGNWGTQKSQGFFKVGVCQLLTMFNHASMVSHLRRCISGHGGENRALKPRYLHSSQWGIFDPAETPEGPNSGILKNMSIGAFVTCATSEEPIRRALQSIPEFNPNINLQTCNNIKVFLNGCWIGTTETAGIVLVKLRNLRTRGIIHFDTSISYKTHDRELNIYCDAGRCARPLYVVKNGKLVITSETVVNAKSWHDLISSGCIQYVDTIEEQTSIISTWANSLLPKSNYCEIHPALILSVCCSAIPWPNCNQGPRNSYSSNMTKQSIGIYCSNFMQRFDTSAYLLHYPQKPLSVPQMSKYFGYSDLACGMNAIVAILPYTGFGQEDSVILNQGAVDRGLFACTVFKSYSAEERNQDNQTIESIEPPTLVNGKCGDRSKNYLKLDENGIIKKGSIVKEGDVIIGMTIRRDGKNSERNDISIVHKFDEIGYVDQIHITKNASGNKLVKVRIGFIRLPIMGDKFASRHAQKGTCGIVLPEIDMPYTPQGIRPDIIINPHAIPSRMTIAHLIETITNKKACLTGEFQDATPFQDAEGQMVRHYEQVATALHKHGFHSRGEEAMYSGFTGELMTGTIFIGPTYYQRLKHMVMDKRSARARGPVQNYTRQPANHGRKNGIRNTSIKVGTMETDVFCSHGAAASVRERLLLSSDKYETEVCDKCGMFCSGKGCGCETTSTKVMFPYPFKLMQHAATAMQIYMGMGTDNSIKE